MASARREEESGGPTTGYQQGRVNHILFISYSAMKRWVIRRAKL